MRVAAISDIHGNLPALEAVLADIEPEGVDADVFAGDSFSGPWPAEVVDLLVAIDARVVQYDRTLPTGLRVVNAGSVGMPYEGVRGAYWALLGPDVEFRRSEYDVEATVAAIEVMDAPVEERLVEYLLEPPDPTATAEYFESVRGT